MKNGPLVSDRAWKLAQLAAILAPKSSVSITQDGKETLSTHNRKVELEWLVGDAEHLLIAAENLATRMHAYQVFNERPGFLSLSAISDQFRKFGVPGLSHHSSCENLLDKILIELRKLVPSPAPPSESYNECSEGNSLWFASQLPQIEDKTLSHFWVPPDTLTHKTPKNQKRYNARTILLLAHRFCRDKFRNDIEFDIDNEADGVGRESDE